jgi:hypothetical protein
MEECVRLMQPSLRGATTVKKRAKTVYSQRNLGTIKERKREKKEDEQHGNGDMILRILRMRSALSFGTLSSTSNICPGPKHLNSLGNSCQLSHQPKQNRRNGLRFAVIRSNFETNSPRRPLLHSPHSLSPKMDIISLCANPPKTTIL